MKKIKEYDVVASQLERLAHQIPIINQARDKVWMEGGKAFDLDPITQDITKGMVYITDDDEVCMIYESFLDVLLRYHVEEISELAADLRDMLADDTQEECTAEIKHYNQPSRCE